MSVENEIKKIESYLQNSINKSIDFDSIGLDNITIRIGNRLVKFSQVSDTPIDVEDEIRTEYKIKIQKKLNDIADLVRNEMSRIMGLLNSYKDEFKRKEKLLTDTINNSVVMPDITYEHARKGLSVVKGSSVNEIHWIFKGIYYPKTLDRLPIEPKFSKRLLNEICIVITTNKDDVTKVSTRKSTDISLPFKHYHKMSNGDDCWGNWKWSRKWKNANDILSLALEAEAVLENINSMSIAERNPNGLPRFETLRKYILSKEEGKETLEKNKETLEKRGVVVNMNDDNVWSTF